MRSLLRFCPSRISTTSSVGTNTWPNLSCIPKRSIRSISERLHLLLKARIGVHDIPTHRHLLSSLGRSAMRTTYSNNISNIQSNNAQRKSPTPKTVRVVCSVSARVGQTTLRNFNLRASLRNTQQRRGLSRSAKHHKTARQRRQHANSPQAHAAPVASDQQIQIEAATAHSQPSARMAAVQFAVPVSYSLLAQTACAGVYLLSATFVSHILRIHSTVFNPPPLYGRPGGNRTPNLRFWRPPLCQLSYWPKTQ